MAFTLLDLKYLLESTMILIVERHTSQISQAQVLLNTILLRSLYRI